MKQQRKQWLQLCNRMLSGTLVLLGFASCTGEEAQEYGQPYAEYQIKGKVTDTDNRPMNGARIIVKEQNNDGEVIPYQNNDTLYTEQTGTYIYTNCGLNAGRFRVVCEDPTGINAADSTDVKMEPSGGSGWYQGSDSKEVNFQLKKKE
ncbi:MAG: radical SAM-associated putative lipoprotein [Bacteroides sp.]|nr:radical SAM-associated putative lipoprotein [Bacteroides sp.]